MPYSKFKMNRALPLLLLFLSAVSCKQKVSDSKPVVNLVAETIAGKRPLVQAKIKAYNPRSSKGEIVVFGSASEVIGLANYLDTVDIFDNVDGRLLSDGLPDFCGETIGSVVAAPLKLDDDAQLSAFRTSLVKCTLALMDTLGKSPGKMIVFTSADVAAHASYDLDSLFRAFGVESPVVYASEQKEETAMQCFRELRRRNAFTHRISYPEQNHYVALPDSEGEYMIIATNERIIQD